LFDFLKLAPRLRKTGEAVEALAEETWGGERASSACPGKPSSSSMLPASLTKGEILLCAACRRRRKRGASIGEREPDVGCRTDLLLLVRMTSRTVGQTPAAPPATGEI
jgi:hypothetical protein